MWHEEQEAIKREMIEVTYSFWDGKGHRNSVKVPKGFTIDQFLNKCRRRGGETPPASLTRECSPPRDVLHRAADVQKAFNKAC